LRGGYKTWKRRLLLDEKFQPTKNGILSVDNRASGTLAKLREEKVLEKAQPLTVNQVWVASTRVLMRWIKDNELEVYRQARIFA
jgi:sugar (pentulose or hexulose) kinase